MANPCDPFAKTIAELAMLVGSRPGMKSLADVTAAMDKLLPELNLTRETVVASILEATTGHHTAKTEIAKQLDALRREARSDKALREKIDALRGHLDTGTLPIKPPKPGEPPDDIADLRAAADDLRAQLRKSEPALRERYEKQITDLTDRLANGLAVPTPKAEPAPLSKELERLVYQRDRLRRQINQQIADLKPKTVLGKVAGVAGETINLSRSLMTSADLSAVFRQGGIIVAGHPIRAAAATKAMFEAVASKSRAHAINQEIFDRPNAPLYARHKLYLAEEGAPLSKQEEAFMSRLAEKIPVVAASQRAYTTFLNRLRADSFDAMVETLARNGEVTGAEAKAIANYINVATGRGSLGVKGENAGAFLSTVFFAPRYVTSRFQYLLGQPLYRGSWRTRKLIAKEYARSLAGAGVVLGLGALAGGSIEWDPRSADFLKMRFGNTRIDPMAGLSQASVLMARLAKGETKNEEGDIIPIRGPRRLHGEATGFDVMTRFLRSKLAPIPASAVNLGTGTDQSGKPATLTTEAKRLVTPISFSDVLSTMEEQGVPRGTAMALLSMFGMGLQHYDERNRKQVSPSEIERRRNRQEQKAMQEQP